MKNPDDNNWKKLTHEIKYLQYTRHLPLILQTDGKGITIWIHCSHNVHTGMKGYVCLYASIGKGDGI